MRARIVFTAQRLFGVKLLRASESELIGTLFKFGLEHFYLHGPHTRLNPGLLTGVLVGMALYQVHCREVLRITVYVTAIITQVLNEIKLVLQIPRQQINIDIFFRKEQSRP